MSELQSRIEYFLKSDETRDFVSLKDSHDPISELNYPNLFFQFHKVKDSYELIISKTRFFTEIELLKNYITEFMISDKMFDSIDIHNSLRKPIRELKNLYPELYYFAKTTGRFYQLLLSKSKFDIPFNELEYNTRKMFIEYSGLKIDPNIDKETYDLLNPHLELDAKFKELSDVLLDIGSEKDFINKHYAIVADVVNALNKYPKYQEWVEYAPITHKPKLTTRNINVYQEQNNGSYFMSIDLKSANYQILHLQGFIDESWTDFLRQFTPYSYHHKSKFLRLKCLSHASLLPKKQQAIWRYTTIEILNAMIDDNFLSADILAALNNDEIIVKANLNNIETPYMKYVDYFKMKFPHLMLSIEIFQLKKIGKYYVKMDPFTQEVKFKCVNAKQMPELVKIYNEQVDNTS